MTESSDEISRLADAIDAFLDRDPESGETGSAYLARHPRVRDLLEPMLFAGDAQPAGPRIIGPYHIHRELGRGGMGVVYEAQHESLHRTVALKILPSLLSAWPKRIERFLREAAAVARLDHRGIVRVFDAGECDGVFYYAMELVQGRTVRDALQEVRQRCQDDPRRLADEPHLGLAEGRDRIDEIAALGAAIADALSHAHEQGVVHRDVKPQNLLIDSAGAVRLVDFGLAKLLGEEMTASADFAGTPHYASPEQLDPRRGAVDERADLFGLGVVLFELATLRRPFEGASSETLLRAILEDEPRALRAFDPRIPRDFEAIVQRALEKTPSARYSSARELAEDLERFRAGESVKAQRHHWSRRFFRWLKRRPATATALMLGTLLLVGGPSAALWFTAQSRAAIERERDIAASNFATARRAVESLLLRVAAQDLPDAPLVQTLRLRLVEDARAFYAELLEAAGATADPGLLLEATRASHQAGAALFDLGRAAEAREAFSHAMTLAGRVLADQPDHVRARMAAATARTGRALATYVDGERDLALREFDAARADWAALDSLVSPGSAQADSVARGMIHAELRLADSLRFEDPKTAKEAVVAALVILGRFDRLDHHQLAMFAGEANLLAGEIAAESGDRATASSRFDAAGEAFATATSLGGHDARLRGLEARLIEYRALIATTPAEVESHYRAAIELREELVADFPAVPTYRSALAAAQDGYACFLVLAGRPAAARPVIASAVKAARELLSKDPSHAARYRLAKYRLTEALVEASTGARMGVFEGLETEFENLIREDPSDSRSRSELGGLFSNQALLVLRQRGDPQVAIDLLQRAVAAQTEALELAPHRGMFREKLLTHRQLLVEAAFRAEDWETAAEALLQLVAAHDGNPDMLARDASALARCARQGVAAARSGAVDALRRLGEIDPPRLRELLDDESFSVLRGDPVFQELLSGSSEEKR